jgi:hypothetical protein
MSNKSLNNTRSKLATLAQEHFSKDRTNSERVLFINELTEILRQQDMEESWIQKAYRSIMQWAGVTAKHFYDMTLSSKIG